MVLVLVTQLFSLLILLLYAYERQSPIFRMATVNGPTQLLCVCACVCCLVIIIYQHEAQ